MMRHSILTLCFLFLVIPSCGKDNPPIKAPDKEEPEAAIVFAHDFKTGLGPFTVHVINKDEKGGGGWLYDSQNAQYGAQAKGAGQGMECWLVSPEIDLGECPEAYLSFDHAFAYVKGGHPSSFFSVWVSADDGVSWINLEIPKWLASHSYFELAQSGDIPLSALRGKKIKIAFVYKSSTDDAPTWEILNMTVSTERQTLIPDDRGDQYKTVPVWMELPAVKDTSAWHAHTTIIRFDRARDYSFSYNEACLVADWVAYPLYEKFTKNRIKRKNSNWEKDPFLSRQSDVTAGAPFEFSSKGYDRGHQIPSADRLGGAMTNQHTFYYSNVTPQQHDFNSGIWEKLETAVREWVPSEKKAPYDTLYVVTGCVADKSCSTVMDHLGQAVAIPKAYYKALLRLKDGNYLGAGFYLEHKNTNKEYKDFACSLQELEEMTGMTFFVNLPADKAIKIKAENPRNNPFWNLK